jgi:hypothetical protein
VRKQLQPSRRGANDGSQIKGEGRNCTWAATLASEKNRYRNLHERILQKPECAGIGRRTGRAGALAANPHSALPGTHTTVEPDGRGAPEVSLDTRPWCGRAGTTGPRGRFRRRARFLMLFRSWSPGLSPGSAGGRATHLENVG